MDASGRKTPMPPMASGHPAHGIVLTCGTGESSMKEPTAETPQECRRFLNIGPFAASVSDIAGMDRPEHRAGSGVNAGDDPR